MLLNISTSIGAVWYNTHKSENYKNKYSRLGEIIIQETQTNFLMDLNHDCQRKISQVYVRLNPIHVELAETERLSFAGGWDKASKSRDQRPHHRLLDDYLFQGQPLKG